MVMIEDRDVPLADMDAWKDYEVPEPKRFEGAGVVVVIFLFLALLGIAGGISLWLFLSGRVG